MYVSCRSQTDSAKEYLLFICNIQLEYSREGALHSFLERMGSESALQGSCTGQEEPEGGRQEGRGRCEEEGHWSSALTFGRGLLAALTADQTR